MPPVRDYRREDFNALMVLYERSKGDEFRFEPGFPERFLVIPLPLDETRLKAFGESEALVVEAEDEEGLAGVIYWQNDHIVGLLVDPCARGKGVGRTLMVATLARMKGPVTLNVVASNVTAIRLYESLHFQDEEQREGFYQGELIRIIKMRRGPTGRA
ncbi:Mycothiol acetyltransferase [Kushneria phyllosphaerae]|uniref:Mycothiol acetyltransferase n=2 Tax=Kushneria phyllosphaerae TaxID=2100822 RepID=A0A2R8CLI1_9GAMM|nr:Mycothiol acetyltransferase [Kushneria phyllosphaerae]